VVVPSNLRFYWPAKNVLCRDAILCVRMSAGLKCNDRLSERGTVK